MDNAVKKIKCSNCGSTRLLDVEYPLHFLIVDGNQTSAPLTTYLCADCGHYEFFSHKLAKMARSLFDDGAEINSNVDSLLSKIKNADEVCLINLKKLENEKNEINLELKSLDITIRKKNELEQRLVQIWLEEQTTKGEHLKAVNDLKKKIEYEKSCIAKSENDLNYWKYRY